VPEQNFSNIECLEDYNDLKSTIITNNYAHVNSINIQKLGQTFNIFHIIFLFLLLCLCKVSKAMTINDSFQYCALTSTSLRINIENLCPLNMSQQMYNIFPSTIRSANLTILSKRQNKISGLGIHCTQEILSLNATWRWYFAYDISDVYSNSVHLTKEDCIKMQQTRICASQQMKCINNDCVYEQLPTPDWNYLRSTQSHGIRCTFKSIMLLANDISTPLFVGNTPHVCLPIDTQCQLHTGIVIWSPDIIHEFNYDLMNETILMN
jgi:hypothetical protein